MKLDIWQDPEGMTMLCFSGEVGEESRTLLEPNSKIIYSFNADSHFDAMTKYYEFMDWGVYETDFESDKEPYIPKEMEKRAKVRTEIDKILWDDWDPLGVNDIAPRDEYKSYVPQILSLVMNGSSIDEIAARLHHIESQTMGVGGDKERCRKIAEKIKQRSEHSHAR
ncbi:MAG TPA: hypothetical protein VE978_00500 [Chitinophagales bacterium]|nr:hypothetical protein [Chitinophagales bacterium]